LISANFDEDTKEVHVLFSGKNFSEFVGLLKLHHFMYSKEERYWTGTAGKFLSIIDDIQDIETYIPTHEFIEKLRIYEHGVKETKLVRKLFRSELLKAPVLGTYQTEDIKKMITQNRLIHGHDVGLGKAQPLYAKILTPMGYKTFEEIVVGDEIINPEGSISIIEAIYEQGEKEVFCLTFSDGAQAFSCKEHLWSYHTSNDRVRGNVLRTKSLEDIVSKPDRNFGYDCFIPLTKPILFYYYSLSDGAFDREWGTNNVN
jgi:hypothetical protein